MSWLTARIEGLEDGESRGLLRELFAYVDQPRFYWTHQWHPGDVVVWDNRCTNHMRTSCDPAQRRVLRRVQIAAGTRLV